MRKDWDVAVAEARRETVEFTLGGETFGLRTPLPAVAFADYATAVTSGAAIVIAQVHFLARCSDDDQVVGVERVMHAMRVSKIDAPTFDRLVTEMVKEITARPTGPPSASAPSPSTSGPPSRDESASPPESGSVPPPLAPENS